MKITFLGHSCFLFETASHRLIIDPFLSGNPAATVKPADVKCDFVLVTHGHSDHIGDTLEIANNNDATIITSFEVADWFSRQGAKKVHPLGLGGGYDFPFGRVKLTIAFHSAGGRPPEGDKGGFIYLGVAAGVLIFADGKTLFHAGDTALSLEMQLIGQLNQIDVAMLPIGDNFTMGPADAVIATEFLKPKLTLPMHYNTFPPIKQDAAAFVSALAAKGLRGQAPAIGESITL